MSLQKRPIPHILSPPDIRATEPSAVETTKDSEEEESDHFEVSPILVTLFLVVSLYSSD